jgi:hypothetical protein
MGPQPPGRREGGVARLIGLAGDRNLAPKGDG